MKIEKIKDNAYKVTLASGEVIILDWNELCSIANFVALEEAKEELEEFFETVDDYKGVNLEEMRLDPEFMENVAYDLLGVRTNNETTDDVYDALNSTLVKEGAYDAR